MHQPEDDAQEQNAGLPADEVSSLPPVVSDEAEPDELSSLPPGVPDEPERDEVGSLPPVVPGEPEGDEMNTVPPAAPEEPESEPVPQDVRVFDALRDIGHLGGERCVVERVEDPDVLGNRLGLRFLRRVSRHRAHLVALGFPRHHRRP